MEARRLTVYRELIFNNVASFLAGSFPVLHEIYGEEGWHALMRDFLVRHRAHTPLFPEMPREFLQFVERHRGVQAGDPPFLLELAHYEWLELVLMNHTAEPDFDCPAPTHQQWLAHSPQMSPLAELHGYQFDVHRIRPDYQPTEPPEQPTFLVVYRDPKDKVRFLEANAVTARLLALISEHAEASGAALIDMIAGEMGQAAEVISEPALQLLDDLYQRRILLGVQRAAAQPGPAENH